MVLSPLSCTGRKSSRFERACAGGLCMDFGVRCYGCRVCRGDLLRRRSRAILTFVRKCRPSRKPVPPSPVAPSGQLLGVWSAPSLSPRRARTVSYCERVGAFLGCGRPSSLTSSVSQDCGPRPAGAVVRSDAGTQSEQRFQQPHQFNQVGPPCASSLSSSEFILSREPGDHERPMAPFLVTWTRARVDPLRPLQEEARSLGGRGAVRKLCDSSGEEVPRPGSLQSELEGREDAAEVE